MRPYVRAVLPSAVAVLVLALAGPTPAAVAGRAAPPWQAPLAGATVARPFSYDRHHPFEPGRRRVAYLAAPPGRPVRSPCEGRVLFAGSLPAGRGASIGCGRLVATLTGLGAVSAGRGRPVAAGQPVGRVASSGRFGLGARVAGDRFGYLDPLGLIGRERRAPLLAPARRPGRPLAPRRRVAPRPAGAGTVAAVLLAAAWLGLGVAGSAIGIGIALRGPRRAGAPAVRARPAGR